MKLQLETKSADETEQLAERLGRQLRGGEVIELVSDLGGGKTTFVRGLARGIGSVDRVTSPTFTISKVYQGARLMLYHFDFYRLADAGLMEHELHDIISEPDVVTVVEWGDVVAHVLPTEKLTIRLRRTGDETRLLDFEFAEPLAYIAEDLK